MKAILMEAVAAVHAQRGRVARGGRRTTRPGGVGRGKVDYATLEYCGEPHRDQMTEAEKQLVRNNLVQVNRRLREAGMREIDPNDPTMRERYGL